MRLTLIFTLIWFSLGITTKAKSVNLHEQVIGTWQFQSEKDSIITYKRVKTFEGTVDHICFESSGKIKLRDCFRECLGDLAFSDYEGSWLPLPNANIQLAYQNKFLHIVLRWQILSISEKLMKVKVIEQIMGSRKIVDHF